MTVDAARIRAWWWRRQGLDGALSGQPPDDVLAASGWARSVGGAGPYLTLFARAGTSRNAADASAAALSIHELPSARGCTYVVPAQDFALALKAAHGFSEGDMKTACKLGVTDAEIDRLCDAVLAALKNEALEPDRIREACGGAVRHLGAEGQKKGLTTTLPVALGRLQTAGEVRRIPVSGRLDQQRYRYARWSPNPLAGYKLSIEETYVELARRYFRWIGPAAVAEFQWFSGLGVKAAKSAVEPLGLVPPVVGDPRLLFPDDRDALLAFQSPRDSQYALVSSLDSIALLRRDVQGLLDAQDATRPVFSGGGLTDLPSHAILDRGRLIGLWEFDTATQAIAWMSLVKRNRELEAAVRRTEEFVRDQLGDARAFSLDSPKSRAARIEALRAGT